MPSINLEMMKQLMQEFSEKEALTTEEINVIETELVNLEQRIESCNEKLKNLNSDKDKLASMQERYASGKFTPHAIADSPPEARPSKISQKKNIEIAEPKTEEPVIEPLAKADQTSSNLDASATPSSKGKAERTKEAKESESPTAAKETEQNSENKENGDTIKSINDALKGLFRK